MKGDLQNMLTTKSKKIRVCSALTLAGLSLSAALAGAAQAQAAATVGEEQYRPAIHYTPEQNWLNDPNGMVFHKGVYHLYYQHNPSGNTWGNMSWGHATSKDLTHWKEQPLAIPTDDQQDIFSGSVVVDKDNTSGFGTAGNPPLVAVFTSAYKDASPHRGLQAQSLAYSLDDGQTWTKYDANPVLTGTLQTSGTLRSSGTTRRAAEATG
ncbi:sucrose-6-phosphate hydrolase SacC (GH32 family) [Arthrobacter sp. V4I6]|nr:sucrose-6-phosphate hydrolase SacC (GH32 family) [Arthrobacter sp. V1I7]MDQ0854612.1 sucrose-6-phosphate hydrolase SacC (GH32 family) [Arthrobacter sp. V4I6]